MSTPVESHALVLEQLHPSICLLRLLAERPANLDELVFDRIDTFREQDTSANAEGGEDFTEVDLEDAEIITAQHLHERNPEALLDKVLDRLAETLARYKSDRKINNKGPVLDPKHVSSTMMIIDREHNKVKILCAKNEGLDQHESTDDTDFLSSWKACMERISSDGVATENDKVYMLDMSLKYQRPRITYYLNKLKQALRFEKSATCRTRDERPKLSDEWLQTLPLLHSRSWIDDNGNEFQFLVTPIDSAENVSRAAMSAQSLGNIEDEVNSIFTLVDEVSSLDENEDDHLSRAVLQQLLPSLFSVWRSPRFQAAIKACLHTRLQGSQNPEKRQHEALTALTFLCRVYYSVDTFVQAAQSMPIFNHVECIPVPFPPAAPTKAKSSTIRALATPLETTKSLRLYVSSVSWLRHLESETTKNSFCKLRGEKCHVHAEIQLLCHQNQISRSRHEDGIVHPYIGCSKLCCVLCWLLLRVHGAYRVRGTHETIMHRWELPTALLTEAYSEYVSILHDFLGLIRTLLQGLLNQPFPLRHPMLLAQSSAALSTTETVLAREKAQMEKSELNMRRLMMMPTVADGGLLVTDLYEKPGFVIVMGGSLSKPKEMSCEDAEIYRENHIRATLGLERTDEMPPKQGNFARTCRRCRQPASLRCSSCRSDYCSRACQKKHWSRHVFVCKVANRPNDLDYFKVFVIKWSHATGDELRQAQILCELYSDDDLCKTFGFNNCAERSDVDKLLCFYTHMISRLSTKGLQLGVGAGNLGDYMAVVADLIHIEGKESYLDCPCFTWFFHRRSFIDCEIPNWAGDFAYQAAALRRLERALSMEERDEDVHPLSISEREVLKLYSVLFRDFNNIPGPLDSIWLKFGFCFCTNRSQSVVLAKLYLQLAKSGASLEEIARAYEDKTLPILMKRRSLNVSILQAKGIAFHRPDLEDLGIYRLISEVNHTLSGRFCPCHLSQQYCHPKFETYLSIESDGDYGFHGTNTWERWQLFNFYKHVFDHPNFDARRMQEAKRHPDKEKFDQYLDSLVPDFRNKIGNRVLADIMFPKLKAHVKFPHGRPPCWCVMHDTIAPEGLDAFTSGLVSQLRLLAQSNEEKAVDDSNLIGD